MCAKKNAIQKETLNDDEDITVTLARVNQKGSITIAVIGLIGSLITALIVAIANPDILHFFILNQTTATATQTAVSTSTLVILPSPSPSAIFTLFPSPSVTFSPSPTVFVPEIVTVVPTVTVQPTSVPGDDWNRDCIDLTTWTPLLADGEVPVIRNCAQLAPWGITAQDDRLILNTLKSVAAAREYGILASVPVRAEIDISIQIKNLRNSEVWIGVLDGNKPNSLEGFVFVIQPSGAMDFRELPSQKAIVNNQTYPYVTDKYPVKIILDAGQISIAVDKNRMVSGYPISFSNRKLFIGYRSLPSTQLEAFISDLSISVP